MTIEIVELSMVLRSWAEICSPLGRLSSMKVRITRRTKALYKWPMKPRRVSSPLKLKKTSKFMGRGVKEEDETSLPVTRDMGNIGIDGWDDLRRGGGEPEKERNGIWNWKRRLTRGVVSLQGKGASGRVFKLSKHTVHDFIL